jgi:hypothetical protein
MAAPSLVEVSNMKVWNLHRHYFNNRQMYVLQGRGIAAAIRVMLQKAAAAAHTQPASATVSEDDIAASFRVWLLNDKNWTAYLAKKSHMTHAVVVTMTDTMARFIAWEAYVDITK